MSSRYDSIKRCMDAAVATGALALTAPLQAVIAASVRAALGSPVIFKQERPGLGGRPFTLYKFRTMKDPDPERGLISNEQRTTRFGQLLRSTSLDELPSLLNVVRGEMSLVGPRPLRLSYLPRFSRHHSRRHDVRPGMTGLAQVNGRNSIGWNSRLNWDVEYVTRRSLGLDLSILVKTVRAVIVRDGVRHEGSVSMTEFMGSGPAISVRRLEAGDLPERVRWLNHPATRRGISISFTADLPGTEQWFEANRDNPHRKDYVCTREDGDLIAMFGLVDLHDDPHLYLYVRPDAHGQGYGRLALVHLIKEAERSDIDELHLEVKTENSGAIRLYQRFGFEVRREIEAGHKLVMSRAILSEGQ